MGVVFAVRAFALSTHATWGKDGSSQGQSLPIMKNLRVITWRDYKFRIKENISKPAVTPQHRVLYTERATFAVSRTNEVKVETKGILVSSFLNLNILLPLPRGWDGEGLQVMEHIVSKSWLGVSPGIQMWRNKWLSNNVGESFQICHLSRKMTHQQGKISRTQQNETCEQMNKNQIPKNQWWKQIHKNFKYWFYQTFYDIQTTYTLVDLSTEMNIIKMK